MSQQPKKILIIEDEPSLLEMYKLYFERAGFEVLAVNNGRPGLELAKNKKPDLILLDILMPDVNGWQVIKELKGHPQTNQIPILVFSNLGQAEEIQKGLNLGADDYIVKTDLTPKELLAKVERMISYIKGGRQKEKRRVLIIEDEQVLADLYKIRLEKEGFETEVARNGAWGLRLAKIGDFDLILMDMVMPALDGYQAIEMLKKDPRTKKTPLIVFSNSAQESDIKKALELGAAGYLLKSKITPAGLVKEVKKLLK